MCFKLAFEVYHFSNVKKENRAKAHATLKSHTNNTFTKLTRLKTYFSEKVLPNIWERQETNQFVAETYFLKVKLGI